MATPRERRELVRVEPRAGGVRVTVYASAPGSALELGTATLDLTAAEELLTNLERIVARLRAR